MFGGAPGPLRMFNSIVGGQIAWLLPLAALGLLLGLWTSRGAPRTDLRRSAYMLWGGWAAVSWMVFSFSKGIFHPYYTTALAPAVAVLAAGGLVTMWDRSRSSTAYAALLAAALIGTAVLSSVLLGRTAGFAPGVGLVAIVLAAGSAGSLLLLRVAPATTSGLGSGRVAWLVAVAGLVAVLAGPTAYSLATVGKPLDGGNPLAGPASAGTSFGGGPTGGPSGAGVPRSGGLFAGRPAGAPPPGAPGEGIGGGSPPAGTAGASGPAGALRGAPTGAGGAGFAQRGTAGATVSEVMVKYLEAHQHGAAYLVAAVGSSTSASIALQSARNVINMGGFMGSDPAPSLAKLKHFIAAGELHYVLLSSARQGGAGGGPGGGSGASSSATRTRDAWIRSHGTVVHVSGASPTGGEMTLYHFSGAT